MSRRRRSNYISKNGFSPSTNRFVGSTLHSIVFLLVTYVPYQIWGTKMFTEIWFYITQAFAYWFVGFFLRKIGFWVY